MEKPRNGFKLQAMKFITEKDLQEKERKVYSPEYHFGQTWVPTTNMSHAKLVASPSEAAAKLDIKSLKSNPYMSEGAFVFGLPALAIGGVLWIDNNRIFFTDLRKGQISTLRLRVSPHLPFCALGAYWLPREERLVIHDIYKFGGKNVWSLCSFTERWTVLGQVVSMIQQDIDLQGFTLELANLRPLGEEFEEADIVVIQPQKAGARSFRIHGWPSVAAEQIDAVTAVTQVPATTASNTTASQLWITKDTIRSGPEAYLLIDDAGAHCGVPAIQGLAVSQSVRKGLVASPRLRVRVRWNVHFGRYEVQGLA